MNAPDKVTYFASTEYKGKDTPFGIKQRDRDRHMYVVGKTGTGKSTLLENMMVQDIKNGEGFACIDSHGTTIDKLLDCIPRERIEDVIYIAPHKPGHALAFNILEDVPAARRHIVVASLIPVFRETWHDVWNSQFEYVLSNTLIALLSMRGAHLLDAKRLFTDSDFRHEAIKHTDNAMVRNFFDVEYQEEAYQAVAKVIIEKVHHLALDPLMCEMLGKPTSSFSMRDVIDKRMILLVHIPKGLVGEANMRILGSLFATRLFLASMSRADMAPEDLARASQFHLYVDEFQNIASDIFPSMLSEARKYKLDLVLSHQYLHQISQGLRDAIFGNVGTFVMFRVSPQDADYLERIFSPTFTKEELLSVGLTQIYIVLSIDGIASKPFTAKTIPPIEKPALSMKEEILRSTLEDPDGKLVQEGRDAARSLKEVLAKMKSEREAEEKKKSESKSEEMQRILRDVVPQGPRRNARKMPDFDFPPFEPIAPLPPSPPLPKKPYEIPEETLKAIFKEEV